MPESPAADWLAEAWSKQLTLVCESMIGESPIVAHATCEFSETVKASGEEDFLWWRQALSIDPSALAWIGAGKQTWQETGSRVLRSAGVDDLEPESTRSTYLEIIQQALSGFAGAISSKLGQEVACAEGHREPPSEPGASYSFEIKFGEVPLQIVAVFSTSLSALGERPVLPNPVSAAAASPLKARHEKPAPNSIDLLLDVELPVSVSFGRAQLALKDIIKLTTGSIVELNRAVSEPVEVIVNNCVIARGEVVVVEGNFGIRIKEVISRQERLRTLY